MADKAIGDLTQATYLDDESLLVVEQQGEALKMTGKMFANFAREAAAADVQKAVDAAASAETAKTGAETAADRAEAARDSIVLDEQKMAQAVADAQASADSASQSAIDASERAIKSESWAVGGTGTRTDEDVNNAMYWAQVAEAEADRATIPVVNVYNVVLQDKTTGEKYSLIVEGGVLKLLGVSDTLSATDLTIIDTQNGTAYAIVIDGGVLNLEEV